MTDFLADAADILRQERHRLLPESTTMLSDNRWTALDKNFRILVLGRQLRKVRT